MDVQRVQRVRVNVRTRCAHSWQCTHVPCGRCRWTVLRPKYFVSLLFVGLLRISPDYMPRFRRQTLWIAITVAVVAQKTAGMAIRKGLMRIAGTLLGTLLALVLVMAAYVMVPFINPEDVNTALCWVFGIYVPLMVFFTSIARLTSSK